MEPHRFHLSQKNARGDSGWVTGERHGWTFQTRPHCLPERPASRHSSWGRVRDPRPEPSPATGGVSVLLQPSWQVCGDISLWVRVALPSRRTTSTPFPVPICHPTSSPVDCLFTPFVHFLTGLFSTVEFGKLFVYLRNESFIGCVVCKHFLFTSSSHGHSQSTRF